MSMLIVRLLCVSSMLYFSLCSGLVNDTLCEEGSDSGGRVTTTWLEGRSRLCEEKKII